MLQSNQGTEYSYQAWQSQRHSNTQTVGRKTLAGKNVQTDSVSLAGVAFESEDTSAFTAWLDDSSNYAERTINGKKQSVRRVCSLSCNVPDDVYFDFVQYAAGDKARLDDGDMTYALRQAVWEALGRDGYADWAASEAARITEEKRVRMSGTASKRAEEIKQKDTQIQSMASELAELKAMLANMQKAS